MPDSLVEIVSIVWFTVLKGHVPLYINTVNLSMRFRSSLDSFFCLFERLENARLTAGNAVHLSYALFFLD